MKFLLDANVEYRLASFLTSLRHDVKTIAHDYPDHLTDYEVLQNPIFFEILSVWHRRNQFTRSIDLSTRSFLLL